MGIKRVISLAVGVLLLSSSQIQAAEPDVPVKEVIDTIKNMNFVTMTLGIISTGVSKATVEELTKLQTAMPRQMRIYVTESGSAREIFADFTFLVNEKKANAILIWPSESLQKPGIIKKICYMSKKKKIPILTLDDQWLELGAAALIKTDGGNITVKENSVITGAMNFPIAQKEMYTVVQK